MPPKEAPDVRQAHSLSWLHVSRPLVDVLAKRYPHCELNIAIMQVCTNINKMTYTYYFIGNKTAICREYIAAKVTNQALI